MSTDYCKFCDPNYIGTKTDMTAQIQKFGETYLLCYIVNGVQYGVDIEFCPFCGRKLNVEYVVHARWKGAGFGDYECSYCGHRVGGNRLKECPSCKAIMDVEEMDGDAE